MIEIDGARGEGGGQIVRVAVAVAAATGRELRVVNIRARRQNPGLAAQHVAAVGLVAQICGARVEGNAVGSSALSFKPGPLRGGEFRADVGTAGSVPLVLQSALLAAALAPSEVGLTVTGGTDVRRSPSADYISHVLAPLLAKMGLRASVETRRRGHYPKGGGEMVARVQPSRPSAFRVEGPGRLLSVGGRAHAVGLDPDIARRMRQSALNEVSSLPARVEVVEEASQGPGQGAGVTMWAETEHSVLGACALGEKGLRAENVGALAGRELVLELRSQASVDVHAADQLLPYMALGGGGAFTVRSISSHLETTMRLLETLTGARIRSERKYGLMRVECAPARPGAFLYPTSAISGP
ncbi:MAG: RNA 3'-terminal phosphate cyclase [Thermoplasmatota archaeon]